MDVDLQAERNDFAERPSNARSDDSGRAARPFLWLAAIFAVAGALFAGVSTGDFIAHLDRQVHSIHCSFIPGAGEQIGESGCRTIMMSPYSSVFRTNLWGGMPISLLALAVFAYLAARAVQFALRRDLDRKATGFFVLAWFLPVSTSAIYAYIAATEVGATCKLCVGIYVASAGGFVSAIVATLKAEPRDPDDAPFGAWLRWFVEGVAYVAVIAILYLALVPASEKSAEGCGTLAKRDAPPGVILSLGGKGTKAIAVLDPLCPACKSFDKRLAASGLRKVLALDTVLFPLDQSCNWMVKTSLHPGACMVAEAMLCMPDRAAEVLDWAFSEQETLTELAKKDEQLLRAKIVERFSDVGGCLGTPQVKNKLNKSLRFAVANALPVLTPQLFIGDRRVCDEDTDLGLDYAITAMLARANTKEGTP